MNVHKHIDRSLTSEHRLKLALDVLQDGALTGQSRIHDALALLDGAQPGTTRTEVRAAGLCREGAARLRTCHTCPACRVPRNTLL